MRPWLGVIGGTLLLVLLSGCYPEGSRSEQRRLVDARLVNWPLNTAISNGIIRQHTLFPYHFVNGATVLNELGQHDLAVLAAHYKDFPGKMNIRRGDADEALYRARVKTVLEGLTEAGVEADCIKVADDLPGGEGIPSERVVNILKEAGRVRTRPGAGTTPGAETR